MKLTSPAGPVRVALVSGAIERSSHGASIVSLLPALLLCLAVPRLPATQLIPGVYGFGLDRTSNTAGFGTGSTVVHVTNLNNSGSGSLRDAVDDDVDSPVVVVFDTSGVINLESALAVKHSHITIAGQTAPYPGIALHGAPMDVMADNVLVQHLRIRAGDRWSTSHSVNVTYNRDAVTLGSGLGNPNTNIVFDHCTFGWALDETAESYYDYGNVSFNRCLFAEPLYNSIHLDEGTFDIDGNPANGNQSYPWQVESTLVGKTPGGFTAYSTQPGPTDAAGKKLVVDNDYQEVGTNSIGDYMEYLVPIVSSTQRNNEHVVISGLAGPTRGSFTVHVATQSDAELFNETEVADFYASSVEQRTWVFDKGSIDGFSIPANTTALKVRLTISGKNASSSAYSLGVDQVSLSQGHAMGPLFCSGRSGVGHLSIIGSAIAHLADRGPWVSSRQVVLANNVTYNRMGRFVMLGNSLWNDAIHASIIANTFIEGQTWPSWARSTAVVRKIYFPTNSAVYAPDTVHPDVSHPEATNAYDSAEYTAPSFLDTSFTASTSDPTTWSDGMVGFVPLKASDAYTSVLFSAGARPAERDVMEMRVMNDIAVGAKEDLLANRPGTLKNSVAEAGGWPTYAENPSSWTLPNNPNLDDSSDGHIAGNGYTNMEEWLQQLSAQLDASSGGTSAYQAEFAALGGGCLLDNIHVGYHGSGFVNFPMGTSPNGTLTFKKVDGRSGGGGMLRIRYALGGTDPSRTGQLVVNGTSQSITFNSTGAFTTWATKDVPVTLTSGATNTIELKSTGSDLANIDEVVVVGVFDDFEDGNAAGWTATAGSWNVELDGTNHVYRQSNTAEIAPFALIDNSDCGDQSIVADATLGSFGIGTGWFGLVARYTDSSNYYYAKISGSTAEIKKLVGGTITGLSSVSFTPVTATPYTVKFVVTGNPATLTLYIDGVQMGSPVTDSSFVSGQAGLLMYRADASYDNVSLDPTPTGTTLVADDFADGNDTGWTESGGSWAVASQAYRQSDAGTSVTARSTQGGFATDQVVEADVKPLTLPTGRWVGIMARYNDASNYYYLKLAAGNVIELKKLVGNSPVVLASGTHTITTGTTYALRLEVVGTSLRAYIDGQLVLRANDTAFASGSSGAGLITYGATADFDDVVVTAP